MSEDFTATLPRKRMGAGILLTDDQGRVLLVEPTYKPYFEIPGGAVEADESPYTAVVRELKEELGLPAEELRSWAWCTGPEAGERLSKLLARRINAALKAKTEGTVAYLENGHFVA